MGFSCSHFSERGASGAGVDCQCGFGSGIIERHKSETARSGRGDGGVCVCGKVERRISERGEENGIAETYLGKCKSCIRGGISGCIGGGVWRLGKRHSRISDAGSDGAW